MPDRHATTPEEIIASIKDQAKALKAVTGLSHSQAIEAIARQRGFKSFIALRADLRNGGMGIKNGC